MGYTTRFGYLCVIAIAFLCCATADAHNLFVLVKHQSKGPDLVNVIFEHAPRPGKGGYYQPLLKRGKTWIKQRNDKAVIPLKLDEVTMKGKKFLRTRSATKGPRLIAHSCKWGIYNGRLDFFHGKYLAVSTVKEAKSLTSAPMFPLDFVPAFRSDGLKLSVLFQGQSLANQTIWLWSPGGKQMTRKTDSTGTIRLIKPQPGIWSFATAHTLKGETGQFEGKQYKGVMHGTSFSMRWPIDDK